MVIYCRLWLGIVVGNHKMDYPSKRTTRRKFKMDYLFEFLLKGSLFWRHEFFKLDYHYSHCTGSPHFTRFHFARSSLYTRFIIVPNEFTLCNALHDFLTLYVKRSREKWHLLACTTEKTKEKVKSNLDLPLYLEVIEIDQECEYRTCANRTAPF